MLPEIRMLAAIAVVVVGPQIAQAQVFGLCTKPSAPAPADPSPQRNVPRGDIFGFTSGTDLGEAGDCGAALEYTARAGKRAGSYFAGTAKLQFGATLRDDFAIALSPFVSHHRVRAVPDLDDRSRARFDGVSFEMAHRFVERGETSPLAATIALETRWSRVDGTSGEPIRGFGTELKLFLDMPIGEKYAAALNLNYAPGITRSYADGAKWTRASGTNISAAVTRDVSDLVGAAEETLFIGLEARHLGAFDGIAPRRLNGHALMVGPNLLYKVSDDVAVNLAWTPQVWGRARDVSRALDLDNFERHQFRLKLVMGF
jgi:hypothetical protein